MTAQACKNCHYSKPIGVDYKVECRRYPPSVNVASLGAHQRSAPLVDQSAWCGEWTAHGKRPLQAEPETVAERMHRIFWTGR